MIRLKWFRNVLKICSPFGWSPKSLDLGVTHSASQILRFGTPINEEVIFRTFLNIFLILEVTEHVKQTNFFY